MLNFNGSDHIKLQNFNLDELSTDYIDALNTTSRLHDIDYLEKSTSSNIFQTISKYIKMTNPREWVFILFFSCIITST